MINPTNISKAIAPLILMVFFNTISNAQQSVGIGTDTPNPHAILDLVTEGDQGLLLPRMTAVQRTEPSFLASLTTEDNGLTVFDTTDGRIYFWFNGTWITSTVTLQAGAGIGLSDNTIVNTGDLDASNEVISNMTLTGTTLSIEENNVETGSIDLSPLQDGTGSDDQTGTEVLINSTTDLVAGNVQAALEELQTEILSDGDTDADNETIDEVSLSGTTLTIIENGVTVGNVDFAPIIPPGGTDDQNASEVPVTLGNGLTSNNVQLALEELQLEINTVSNVTSAAIVNGEIINEDISGMAGIEGTKINPDFGTLNISTMGTLEAGAITGTSFAGDGSGLTNVPISVGSVTNASIADNAITTDKIAMNSIQQADIATGGVGPAEIAENAVRTTAILDGTITNADISTAAGIDGTKVIPDFGGQDISTTGMISGDGSGLTDLVIAANSIGTLQIAPNTITAEDIGANAVTASEIATGAVGTAEIADGTITNTDISTTAANRISGNKVIPNFGNQNIITSGNFRYNTTRQRVKTFGPLEFQRLNVGTSNASLRTVDNANFQVHFTGGESNVLGFASVPLKLPDGAQLEGLEATVLDNATSSQGFARITVLRAPYANNKVSGFENILNVETTPAGSSTDTQDLSSGAIITSGAEVIDNRNFVYYILYRADSNTNQIELHGVRLTYNVLNLD